MLAQLLASACLGITLKLYLLRNQDYPAKSLPDKICQILFGQCIFFVWDNGRQAFLQLLLPETKLGWGGSLDCPI